MKNTSMRGIAFPVLVLLSVPASSMAAQEPGNTLHMNKATQHVQVVEPKPVPGIPDVIFGSNPLVEEPSTIQLPPTQVLAQNAERKIQSVVEPKIPRGVPQDQTPAEPMNTATPVAARTGWYAGVSLGQGGLGTDYQRTFQNIFSTGATTARLTPDTKDTRGKAYFGYRLSPYLSIEGGYWDFGETSYSATISAPVVTAMNRSFRVRGIGINDVFWLPSTDSFSWFAKLGAMQVSAKASSAVPGGGLIALPAQSSNTLSLHWGVGCEYALNPDLALRLEFEAINSVGEKKKFGVADILLWTAGAAYKF